MIETRGAMAGDKVIRVYMSENRWRATVLVSVLENIGADLSGLAFVEAADALLLVGRNLDQYQMGIIAGACWALAYVVRGKDQDGHYRLQNLPGDAAYGWQHVSGLRDSERKRDQQEQAQGQEPPAEVS